MTRSRQKVSVGKVSTKEKAWIKSQKTARLKTRAGSLRRAKAFARKTDYAKKIKEQTYHHDRSVIAFKKTYSKVKNHSSFSLYVFSKRYIQFISHS